MKPDYPPQLAAKLDRYPVKHCARCGKRMWPAMQTGYRGKLQLISPAAFARRQCCSLSCATRMPRSRDIPEPESDRTRSALARFQERYGPVIPFEAVRKHGREALYFWSDCLDMARAA